MSCVPNVPQGPQQVLNLSGIDATQRNEALLTRGCRSGSPHFNGLPQHTESPWRQWMLLFLDPSSRYIL